MKTIGKTIVILAAFAIVMGVIYSVVNTSGSSSRGAPQFENGERRMRPDGQFVEREEGRGEGGWAFGLIKNIGIVAVVVLLIVLPKNAMQKRKQEPPIFVK
jgi:hypothetical protein